MFRDPVTIPGSNLISSFGIVFLSSYKKNVYGVLNDKTKKMDSNSITDMVEGERRRWSHADIEGDDALNIVEFQVG